MYTYYHNNNNNNNNNNGEFGKCRRNGDRCRCGPLVFILAAVRRRGNHRVRTTVEAMCAKNDRSPRHMKEAARRYTGAAVLRAASSRRLSTVMAAVAAAIRYACT